MPGRSPKRLLREAMVRRILGLSVEDRQAQEHALVDRFDRLEGRAQARVVLLYARAFPEEFDTSAMMAATLATGQRLVCPRVDRRARRLRLFEVRDLVADFEPGTLGIPEPRLSCPEVEPREVDWALVPGLAFDDRGYRLGRGAGHYDRLLPLLRPDALHWSLALECQWLPAIPDEPHDVRLDGVASPGRTVRIARPDPNTTTPRGYSSTTSTEGVSA